MCLEYLCLPLKETDKDNKDSHNNNKDHQYYHQ